MSKTFYKNNKIAEFGLNAGFSLLELVLAIAIFAIGSIVAGNLIIDANTSTRIDLDKAEAVQIAREGIEAVTSIRDSGFANIATTTPWPHGLMAGPSGSCSDCGWAFSPASSTVVDTRFYRSIYITLTPSSAPFTSISTANVTSTVAWINARGFSDSVSLNTVFTNWHQPGS